MQKSFWDARWREGNIGFHQNEVDPGLVLHWPAASASASASAPNRVLVPLCGKTHDMAWLAARGHEVVGIEFVESAAVAFFTEQELVPARDLHHGVIRLQANGITILVTDIFNCASLALEPFQWVYDRAALVALEPERRAAYAAEIAASCAPHATLLLLSVEHDMANGPPFSVAESSVIEAYGPSFELRKIADQDVLEEEPRFRERGATFLREQYYVGKRSSPRTDRH